MFNIIFIISVEKGSKQTEKSGFFCSFHFIYIFALIYDNNFLYLYILHLCCYFIFCFLRLWWKLMVNETRDFLYWDGDFGNGNWGCCRCCLCWFLWKFIVHFLHSKNKLFRRSFQYKKWFPSTLDEKEVIKMMHVVCDTFTLNMKFCLDFAKFLCTNLNV